MAARFSAFSFVDRITTFEPAKRATGRFHVPGHVVRFPPALVAEAVGQLAAWVAMANVDFARRPVAALAGETRFLGAVAPGDTVELAVEIENCDADGVAYGGWASVRGARVLELERCLGPMLPQEEFDAPAAVRADFEVLRGAGAPIDRFPGVPTLDVVAADGVAGEWVQAILDVPATAPFFGDHFPRRPVFPATLLLHAQTALALELARGAEAWRAGRELALARVRDVKMRAWILPGQRVELRADLAAPDADAATVKLAARVDRATVATGRAEIVPARAAALAAARSA
jgi:3-hydroxymyristoyl/3-hydroxydecanoyl-(acyl carrier protein) dehydratase